MQEQIYIKGGKYELGKETKEERKRLEKRKKGQ